MARDRSLLEREMERVELRSFTLERFHRRRERKQRNRRIGTALVAIAVFVGVMWLLAEQFSDRAPTPAGRPEPPSPMGSPSPVTQPSPPLTERFDSRLHGLSIGYPSGWRTRAATEPWGHDKVAFGAPDVDVIYHPRLRDDLYFAVVSEPLDGQSWSDWCCFETLEASGICSDATGSGGGQYTLDGARGWIEGCGNDVASENVTLVATATRGYIIQLHVGNDRLEETYDGDWFEAALETVDLRPADALER
jgi:hypothetical protein